MGSAGQGQTLDLAIVYPGAVEVRRAASPLNSRFASLFAAFDAQGNPSEVRVRAHAVVWSEDSRDEVREQLLAMDGALVWVNPIEAGRTRAALDTLLREVAAAGVMVSAHPDVILKLGTKTASGSDTHVLCEINVSSVAPFPDSALEPLVRATALRLAQAQARRRGRMGLPLTL